MRTEQHGGTNGSRGGASALELIVILPVLMLIVVIAVDFARLFHEWCIITNCARNGAFYASDAYSALKNSYADYKKAAIADGQSLAPLIDENKITLATGTDDSGDYVEVTVEYEFNMISTYLGFGTVTLKRSVRMRVAPATPD